MRVFVNNADGHLAGAVCADLAKLTREIIGTRKGHIDDLVPPHPMLMQVVPRFEVRQLLKTIASCNVVIYDLHDADFEELELVLRILYQSEIVQDMTFIIISSVGCWARTPREYEEVQELPPETIPEAADEDEAAAANEAADGAAAAGDAPAPGEAGEVEPQEQADPVAEGLRMPARPRPRSLKSEDYIRRIPAPKFQEWKTIETLALALKEKSAIRPYVICAGMPYGNGEDAFLGLFRAAWMSLPTLRVIGHGQNSLPLVHVRDVARLVRHVVQERPELDYHLAVDRGDVTQRGMVEAVAQEFGIPYRVQSVSIPEALLAEMADMLTMDLRLEPSPLMEAPVASEAAVPGSSAEGTADAALESSAAALGAPPAAGAAAGDAPMGEEGELASPEVVAEAPRAGFRWWCERGLVANISTVGGEFRRWRRLAPVRLCVMGPPGSAAALLGATLAARYNLPHVVLDDLVEDFRNADTDTGKVLRDKLAEIEAALANPKSNGPFFVPSSVLTKVVEEAVATKQHLYRGFVLSGFPQCLEDATELLTEEQPAPDELVAEDKAVKDKKAGKKGDDAPKTIQVPRKDFTLDGVAIVDCPEEAAMARLTAGDRPEEQWLPTFKRKMERWQKENAEGAAGLADFFKSKLSLTPTVVSEPPPVAAGGEAVESGEAESTLSCSPTVEELLDGAACELLARVEASVEVNNFMPSPLGPSSPAAEGPEEEAEGEDEAARRREEEELRRKRDLDEKLEQIRKDELGKLEKHSEPLRQYLMSFVVPTITSGLVEVCRAQPEDPVGYLSEYLAAYSQLSRKRQRGAKQPASPPEAANSGGTAGGPAA